MVSDEKGLILPRIVASKKIAFRADGNAKIGSGHLHRCLALAGQLRERGYDCLFICGDDDANFDGLVQGFGFECISIVGFADTDKDADQTIRALAGCGQFDALVVDHYQLDAAWHQRLRSVVPNIVVIDDLANRMLDCDLLIDPAPGSSVRYDQITPTRSRKLLGPSYALLRPEFSTFRRSQRVRSGEVGRILISFGGIDGSNLTGQAIAAIRTIRPSIPIDVVLTSLSPHNDLIRKMAQNDPHLSIQIDASNMAELMARADLAIGAGGSTSWERACLGLPSIVVVLSENQLVTANELEKLGCAIRIAAGDNFKEELQNLVQRLFKQPILLRMMSKAGQAAVDGRGVSRVAAAIAPICMSVRLAHAADARMVWEWRNAPEVRATSVESNEIAWTAHQSWFADRLKDVRTVMLIGVENNIDVGFLRYDLEGDLATVSIFLSPRQFGRGIGLALLQAGERWVVCNHAEIRRFRADVRPENAASIALFRRAHYTDRLISFERIINDCNQ